MASWDYVESYNRLPVWLRVVLFPILVPVIVVPRTIGMVFFILAFVPFSLVMDWIENRRFWRKLRERGQVGHWPEVESQVSSGAGTLIVEVTPKGPGCSWLIDAPREVVDPEHLVPSWQQFEEQGLFAYFDLPETVFELHESLDRGTFGGV